MSPLTLEGSIALTHTLWPSVESPASYLCSPDEVVNGVVNKSMQLITPNAA